MPQAKKSRFVVTGRIAGPDAANVGDIIELPVREDGLPESALMRSRVKPYKGELPKGGASVSKADVDKYVEDAEAKVKQMTEEANTAATKLIEDAKAEAKRITDEAQTQAEKTITEALEQADAIVKDAKKPAK